MNKFMDRAIAKNVWLFRGLKANVSITHTNRFGEHCWCLYVLIFNTHPLFEKAYKNKSDYDLDLGDELYGAFHGGCTYYNKQKDWVKIGCDYQHLGDERFLEQEDLPQEIIADARDLYNFFNDCNEIL